MVYKANSVNVSMSAMIRNEADVEYSVAQSRFQPELTRKLLQVVKLFFQVTQL